jgi:uncharacterized pyridoxamine 5'-phosphate oxidase family protein
MKKLRWLMAFALALTLLTGAACGADNEEDETMTNLEFFQSLDYTDGLSVVVQTLERFPLQYATTLGLDGAPQIRPIEFKFEADGVLYFDTVEFYTSYQELLAYPYIQLCVCDQETMTYIRLGGKVNFTRDEDIIQRCIEESPVLASQFGDTPEVIVGYYLTEVWAEFQSFDPSLTGQSYTLTNHFDTEG